LIKKNIKISTKAEKYVVYLGQFQIIFSRICFKSSWFRHNL